MFNKLKLLATFGTVAAVLVLQGCGKDEQPAAAAPSSAAAPAATGKPIVQTAIAKDSDTPPATSFSADVPKLWAFFQTTGTKKGDSLRAVWIAEDVGDAAPKDTKIDEATLSADKDDFTGAFSLSKPNNGWPVGKYRTEFHLGDQLASTAKFTIQ
jgi:hypothetical protein